MCKDKIERKKQIHIESEALAELVQAIRDQVSEGNTINAIAEAAGIYHASVYRYVNDGIYPRIDTAEKLLKAIGYELRVVKARNTGKLGS